MKQAPDRSLYYCPHCERLKQEAALRGPPETEEPPLPGAVPKPKAKKEINQAQATAPLKLWQELPTGHEEINAFGWDLYERMLADPGGKKCIAELLKVARQPKALIGAAFLAGVQCALLELNDRLSGTGGTGRN